MCKQNAAIAEAMWQAWARRDKAAVLALFADDGRAQIHVPQEVLPFGGERFGKAALSDQMQTALDIFETIYYRFTVVSVTRAVVRGRAEFAYRHDASDEVLEGVARLVMRIENGLVSELDTYHDVQRIKAFMRLVSDAASP